jgi:hypothetical protein
VPIVVFGDDNDRTLPGGPSKGASAHLFCEPRVAAPKPRMPQSHQDTKTQISNCWIDSCLCVLGSWWFISSR